MLQTCNVGYFCGIAKKMTHPSWGVTANLLVRGARFNHTIHFKDLYPKTGGGEDIDFVYQFKEWYSPLGRRVIVGVPEAVILHPWWNRGSRCYKQITGWAWGDCLCITEWEKKTFLAFPNWIEHIVFVLAPLTLYTRNIAAGALSTASLLVLDHAMKVIRYYPESYRRNLDQNTSIWKRMWVALGAGSVFSAQEVSRVLSLMRRGSLYSICRCVDWFDGQEERIKLDIQLTSLIRFRLHTGLTLAALPS